MNVTSLSPLQNWLERIHNYLNQEEILKARLASLVLPIFETYELLSVCKKICFESSREPTETLSDLITKANVLALNILFAGYKGFINPKGNYEDHKKDGLIFQRDSDETEIFFEDDLSDDTHLDETEKDFTKKISIQPQEKTIPLQKESISVEDEKNSKKTLHIESVKDTPFIDANVSPRKLDESIPVLKEAPHMTRKLEKRASVTNFHKQYLADKGKSQSEPFRLNEVLRNDNIDFLSKSLNSSVLPSKPIHPRITQIKHDNPIGENETKSELTDEQLKSIQPLIEESMEKKGSWKVKNQHVKVHKSANLNIDPAIIAVLSKAYEHGYLDKINLDQTFTLHQNLKTIERCLGTLKGHHFKQLSQLRTAVQERLVSQWIENDYCEGVFYEFCAKLVSQIVTLIQSGEGHATDNHARLFEEEEEQNDIGQIFEEWKFSHVSSSLSNTKLNVYDYYDILKAYVTHLPEPLQKIWLQVKKAKNQKEWDKAIQSLSKDDIALITDILNLLKEAHYQLWKSDLDEMVVSTEALFNHFCPFKEDEETGYLDYDYIKNYIKS